MARKQDYIGEGGNVSMLCSSTREGDVMGDIAQWCLDAHMVWVPSMWTKKSSSNEIGKKGARKRRKERIR